jgi:valyl-tRNA synthetase
VKDFIEAAGVLQKILKPNFLFYLKGSRLRHMERILLLFYPIVPAITSTLYEALGKNIFQEVFPEVDRSGINVSRVCYESFDPDIYVNEKAAVFTKAKKIETENPIPYWIKIRNNRYMRNNL